MSAMRIRPGCGPWRIAALGGACLLVVFAAFSMGSRIRHRPDADIVLHPTAVDKLNSGNLASVPWGTTYFKTWRIRNDCAVPVDIDLLTSCSCTRVTANPARLDVRQSAEMKMEFDTTKFPSSEAGARNIGIVVRAKAQGQNGEYIAQVAVTGYCVVTQTVDIPERVSLGRVRVQDAVNTWRPVHIKNYMGEPVSVAFTFPEDSALSLGNANVGNANVVTLDPMQETMLALRASPKWDVQAPLAERIHYRVGWSKGSFDRSIEASALPVLTWQAIPPALFVGSNGGTFDCAVKNAKGLPPAKMKIVSTDEQVRASVLENGKIQVVVATSPARTGTGSRRYDLQVRCSNDQGAEETVVVPVALE